MLYWLTGVLLVVGLGLCLALIMNLRMNDRLDVLLERLRVSDEQMDRLLSEAGAANTQVLRVEHLTRKLAVALCRHGAHSKGCELKLGMEGETQGCSCGLADLLARAKRELGEV